MRKLLQITPKIIVLFQLLLPLFLTMITLPSLNQNTFYQCQKILCGFLLIVPVFLPIWPCLLRILFCFKMSLIFTILQAYLIWKHFHKCFMMKLPNQGEIFCLLSSNILEYPSYSIIIFFQSLLTFSKGSLEIILFF